MIPENSSKACLSRITFGSLVEVELIRVFRRGDPRVSVRTAACGGVVLVLGLRKAQLLVA